jgi:predicted enzyme related to lactoylglutathione lyase
MEIGVHAISWFEIPVVDFPRAKRFYEALFDFQMPELEMGVNTMGFLPSSPDQGGIGGAIVRGPGYTPSDKGALVYLFGGKDLSVVLGRVVGAGGSVVQPKTLVSPDLGYWAAFLDSEGNRVALHSMG